MCQKTKKLKLPTFKIICDFFFLISSQQQYPAMVCVGLPAYTNE